MIEQSPVQDGRNMTMMLAPSKAILAGEKSDGDAPAAESEHAIRARVASGEQRGGSAGRGRRAARARAG